MNRHSFLLVIATTTFLPTQALSGIYGTNVGPALRAAATRRVCPLLSLLSPSPRCCATQFALCPRPCAPLRSSQCIHGAILIEDSLPLMQFETFPELRWKWSYLVSTRSSCCLACCLCSASTSVAYGAVYAGVLDRDYRHLEHRSLPVQAKPLLLTVGGIVCENLRKLQVGHDGEVIGGINRWVRCLGRGGAQLASANSHIRRHKQIVSC
jgi:hypothetical protein